MAVQARWHTLAWGYGPKAIRAIENMQTSDGIEVKLNDTDKGKEAYQTVTLNLTTLSFEYLISAVAGGKPMEEYLELKKLLGVHAPFYLGSTKIGGAEMMLCSVDADDWLIDASGRIQSVRLSVKFQQYATGKNKLMLQEINKKKALRAGIKSPSESKASAIFVGPTSSAKASKKAANPRLK